jgi:hypothetical protein
MTGSMERSEFRKGLAVGGLVLLSALAYFSIQGTGGAIVGLALLLLASALSVALLVSSRTHRRSPRIVSWSFVVALSALYVALFATGGGEGTYLPAALLFPWTMISAGFLSTISWPFIALAIVQFPAYGLLLAYGDSRNCYRRTLRILLVLHIVAIVVAFIVGSDSFLSPVG